MRRPAAVASIIALSFTTYWTIRLAIADELFRARSADALARAVRLAPGNAQYFAWLAEYREAEGLDPDSAMAAAARLNPMDSSVKIRQGLRAEFRNDFAGAEKFLLEAAAVDKLFDPRAALANFYFRRNDPEPFWRWTREAFAISYGDLTSLFRLCWRMSADPEAICTRALPSDRVVWRKYLRFLLDENHLDAAEPIATRLAGVADKEDSAVALDFIDRRLPVAAEPAPLLTVWNLLCARNQVPFNPIQPNHLTNGDFRVAPTSRGFDWRVPPIEGVSAVRLSPRGLRIDLTGRQPERCELLVQFVALSPGKTCHLRFNCETSAKTSGLEWRLMDALASFEPEHTEITFSTRGHSLARLVLGYSRVAGTPRLEGSITLRDAELSCGN